MNWFERYGITGIYFITITGAWIYTFTYCNAFWNSLQQENSNIGYIFAIGAVLSLPVGYIIAVFTHSLYLYDIWLTNWFLVPIHRKAVEKLDAWSDLRNKKEIEIEMIISATYRLTGPSEEGKGKNTERLKWMSELIRKRWDVVAISQNLIIATILSLVLTGIYLIVFCYVFSVITFQIHWPFFTFLVIINIIIIFILRLSAKAMRTQLITAYKEVFKYDGRLMGKIHFLRG